MKRPWRSCSGRPSTNRVPTRFAAITQPRGDENSRREPTPPRRRAAIQGEGSLMNGQALEGRQLERGIDRTRRLHEFVRRAASRAPWRRSHWSPNVR